jgi:hypothetical protein
MHWLLPLLTEIAAIIMAIRSLANHPVWMVIVVLLLAVCTVGNKQVHNLSNVPNLISDVRH